MVPLAVPFASPWRGGFTPEHPPAPHRAPGDVAGAPRAPVVLLVEDYADTRELYATYLERRGYRVVEASDGLEGREKALHLVPDIILMDLSIPGIDGWALTRLLKADSRTRDVPVIAVSAHALERDQREAMEAGCTAYLVKPCPPRQLADAIARVLDR